jgi:hypothetical protein
MRENTLEIQISNWEDNVSKVNIGRFGLCLVSLIGLMSMFSVSAFGAGKPTEVSSGISGPSLGLNHAEMVGWANPNGADTTVTLEYREHGASEFKVAGSGSIGSGTKTLGIKILLNGLKPYAQYDLRTKASNEFGTVYGSIPIFETPYWEISNTSLSHVAGVSSSGSANFEWKIGINELKISCGLNGSGWIGGEWGNETGWSANLTSCKFYENGKLRCQPYEAHFTVDQTFATAGGYLNFVFPEGCFYSEVKFQAPNPFFVTMSGFNKALQVTQPMVLTNNLSWAGNTVNATISTNWSLTGADSGKAFGVWRAE